MQVAIIQYVAGNVLSVAYALERLGLQPIITNDHEIIRKADKVIFPGVGAAGAAMHYMKEQQLDTLIKELQQPVLGICLGMQLMCRHSQEDDTECLGIFPQDVKKFIGQEKVPQIGWNNIAQLQSPLFQGIAEGDYMYFVHSYYASLSSNTVAQTDYNGVYSSALQKDNFYAVQFHPEKSGKAGEKLLENFINI